MKNRWWYNHRSPRSVLLSPPIQCTATRPFLWRPTGVPGVSTTAHGEFRGSNAQRTPTTCGPRRRCHTWCKSRRVFNPHARRWRHARHDGHTITILWRSRWCAYVDRRPNHGSLPRTVGAKTLCAVPRGRIKVDGPNRATKRPTNKSAHSESRVHGRQPVARHPGVIVAGVGA